MHPTQKMYDHAELTIKHLECFLKRRGWTSGLKKWELELLFSAYEALDVPHVHRKFGLDKIKEINKVERDAFPS